MTPHDLELLQKAVDVIVDSERQKFPEQGDEFWTQFREVLLATCIEKKKELL